jgi:class 3 adenylate cyclase/pimeloyl-ACP methyl ester carboxylesterase
MPAPDTRGAGRPETRYATTPDGVTLAYQHFGAGTVDLVYSPYFAFNLDALWDFPPIADWLSGLAKFSRVLIHDPRGVGLSDRGVPPGDLGTRARDILALLDAEDIRHVAFMGSKSSGAVGALLGATHPERITQLIWWHAAARERWAEDYPWGASDVELDFELTELEKGWGSTEFGADLAAAEGPTGQVDPSFQEWVAKMLRGSVTPRRAVDLRRAWMDTDISEVLPLVSVPTLVLARSSTAEEAGFVSTRIPGAQFTVLPGGDQMPWFGDMHGVLEAVRAFLGVSTVAPLTERFLATVLFTDIVGSTKHSADQGDERWSGVVAAHHRIVRGLLQRHGGTEMDTAGDGFYATFDSPGSAVWCALEATSAVRSLGVEIRAGAHTGEVHQSNGKHEGIAVTIGARVSALAGPSEVLVSRTVKDLTAGSGLVFEPAGERELKGVPEPWLIYRARFG